MFDDRIIIKWYIYSKNLNKFIGSPKEKSNKCIYDILGIVLAKVIWE